MQELRADGPLAVLGGPYGNPRALRAVLENAHRRGADQIACLGDIGGFGPDPGAVIPILEEYEVVTIAGNYDRSLAARLADCGCGYTHPSDNHFAQVSYAFTNRRTTDRDRAWLGRLPSEARFTRHGRRYLLCHGSPRRVNEFLWESATSDAFLVRLAREAGVDQILCTHTGIPWQRSLPGGASLVNVGAVGRPANDGRPGAWYAFFGAGTHEAEFVFVSYDHEAAARETEAAGLPGEFAETLRTGWWTTCLEILPARERARGPF